LIETIYNFLSIFFVEIFENVFQLGRTLTSPSCAPSLAFPEREKISISTESKKNEKQNTQRFLSNIFIGLLKLTTIN
jgi:hypothetical protein